MSQHLAGNDFTLRGLKAAVLLAAAFIAPSAMCETQTFPPEVRAFIAERRTCEHLLGEVDEGNTPERAERQRFVADSIDIFCAGTDRRLAALRRRYQGNEIVLKALTSFEEKIESDDGTCQ